MLAPQVGLHYHTAMEAYPVSDKPDETTLRIETLAERDLVSSALDYIKHKNWRERRQLKRLRAATYFPLEIMVDSGELAHIGVTATLVEKAMHDTPYGATAAQVHEVVLTRVRELPPIEQ